MDFLTVSIDEFYFLQVSFYDLSGDTHKDFYYVGYNYQKNRIRRHVQKQTMM